MKKNNKHSALMRIVSLLTLACVFAAGCFTAGAVNSIAAYAETVPAAEPAADPSPAVYVAQKNANSVVGVITSTQSWNRSTGEVEESVYSQGSGVAIAEGGYVLTNNHVISKGEAYKVLMPDGSKVDAMLAGADPSVDLAVLKIIDAEAAAQLVPVSVGSTESLLIGSTVVAIGNPGGEVMANTVTQGIVSSLERSTVYSSNTTRSIDYIQHDAAINSGNSGGGLFNYRGELVGINTLKYSGSSYSSVSYDGLGFAIPVDTAYPIALQLIEYGEVIRPQMGITVSTYEGPSEPMNNYAPASVCIYGINEDGPAQKAGLQQYDFIYSVNGERVKSFRELSAIMDGCQAGDTVSVTVVRYAYAQPVTNSYSGNGGYGNYFGSFGNYFGFNPFGGYGYGNDGSDNGGSDGSGSSAGDTSTDRVTELTVGGGYEFITVDVTLEMPADKN